MAYLTQNELQEMGLKALGKNVKISRDTRIYNPERISIGDNSRIDDFCVISGTVEIGCYVHIGPMCLIAGGEPGIVFSDFNSVAYGCKIFSQSDDYSGESLTNPLIPRQFKKEIFKAIFIGKHVILGANTVILPGVQIAEGCSIGAMTLLVKSTEPWGIYVGSPAFRMKERRRDLLALEQEFLQTEASK